MKKHVIFGNFGNDTIALIQWAFENKLNNVSVVSVDTTWSSPNWGKRVEESKALCLKYHFDWVRLRAKAGFAELVQERREFPSKKFSWCAGFLKGLPFNDWLSEHDIEAEALILLPKRRASHKINYKLAEFEYECEYYGARCTWHPLYMLDNNEMMSLASKSEITLISHRSDECFPCIYARDSDFKRLDDNSINRLDTIEKSLGQFMFHTTIGQYVNEISQSPTQPTHEDNLGCGEPWACGI